MTRARVFIIAEAGVNHNGSVRLAKKLIDAAVQAGADAVKFQSFRAGQMVSKQAAQALYQKKTTGANETQYEMLRRLELDEKAHRELFGYCRRRRIEFLSSAFDSASIDLLNNIGLRTFKIPSGEITNLPYLKKIGALKARVILSTGMADLGEVEDALNVLIAGGTKKEQMTILHCNSEYPTPFGDVNLTAMVTLRDAFKIKVGYSDHTPGIEVPIAAVAIGAEVIEKHLTLDKNMEGPDHKASLEPEHFSKMVQSIRNIEKALGDGIKKPSPSEIRNMTVARKSIVALKAIKKGENFSQRNVGIKRPSTGISPMRWYEILGAVAPRDFEADEVIVL